MTAPFCWETADADGKPEVQFLSTSAFKQKHAALKIDPGRRDDAVTDLWLASAKRRTYDGLVFRPSGKHPRASLQSVERLRGDGGRER